eukprot:SAG11_NODE_774_length_7236_cov_2.593807_9_plen_198_part_00
MAALRQRQRPRPAARTTPWWLFLSSRTAAVLARTELEGHEEMAKEVARDFIQEIMMLSKLRHPRLVEFVGFTKNDPGAAVTAPRAPLYCGAAPSAMRCFAGANASDALRLRIVLELMEGGALDMLLYTKTPTRKKWLPTVKQTIKMATDVAQAMSYLHYGHNGDRSRPYIHRDLKSPNLLLERSPPISPRVRPCAAA